MQVIQQQKERNVDYIFDNERPIYVQLVEKIRLEIISGRLKSGERLPSVRELAITARVNPNTMQKALMELEIEGLVYTERTNGKFVTQNKELIENELSIMDYELYNKTKQNNKTYINSSKDMWIKKENNYMILTSDTSEIIDSSNSACIKTYLKLKNISFVEKGVGTQFNPYIIDVQNY